MSETRNDSPDETAGVLPDFDRQELPSSDELDRLTKLATDLLDASAARIVLENGGNLVTVSTLGIDSAVSEERKSLLARMLESPEEFTVINQAAEDPRIESDDLSVDGNSFRACAGLPLTIEGRTVGVFCVYDEEPREFNEESRTDLRVLVDQAGEVLYDRFVGTNSNDKKTKVKRTSKQFQDLVEQAPIAFFLINEDLEFIQVNEQACEQLGYDRDELVGRSIMDIDPNYDSRESILENIAEMEPGDTNHFESTHERKDGTTFPVSVQVRTTHPDTEGFLMSWVTDVSEDKEHERKLRQTRTRLEKIINRAPVAITGIDPNGKVEVWNPAAEDLFGWERDEVMGEDLPLIPEEREAEHHKLRKKAVEGEGVQNIETRRLTKSGDKVDVLLSTATVRNQSGDPELALGIIQDISTLKEVQEKLQQALEEKANLLREVHHRVKNNLQIIKSMMNLHERNVRDRSEKIMDECRDRIQTMAMIHDMLYQSENLARFPFHRYVEELIATILSLNDYADSNTEVSLEIDASVNLPLSMAFPCGLIIHELVSNVCKHAFDNETKNELTVELRRDDDRLILRVKDNGPGFPDDTDLEEIESIGFDILRSLVEYELGGTLEVSSGTMTTVEVQFELSEEE